MPELTPHAADNPEFARVIELRQLRDLDGFDFDIAPDPREADGAGAPPRRPLGAQAALRRPPDARSPAAAGSSTAALGATVVQTCVVTLDPVTTRIDQPVRRAFLPETRRRAPRSSSTPRRTTRSSRSRDRIDLGRVAVEALALALPAYPRKPGADPRGRRRTRRRRTTRPSPSRRWRRCARSSARES